MEEQQKADFDFNDDIEITEEELAGLDVSEETKKLFRFFMEHNPEKKIIRICPVNDNSIILHGAADTENFINAIRDYSREVFDT